MWPIVLKPAQVQPKEFDMSGSLVKEKCFAPRGQVRPCRCAKVHTSLSAGGSRDAVCSTFQWKWPGGATPLCPGPKPNSNALK